MQPAISVLGMGRMGSALAHALLKAGHPTTVWNRTPAKAAPLAAAGAEVAASVRNAVAASEVVIVNVSDYQATQSLLRDKEVAGALEGRLIIELTSGTPDGGREAHGWAQRQGARYLDGAILATPDFIGTEAGTLLVSGPSAVFEEGRNVLGALGGNVQFIGEDPGLANALDSAVLALMWGALFGALQSIAVCRPRRSISACWQDNGRRRRRWSRGSSPTSSNAAPPGAMTLMPKRSRPYRRITARFTIWST